MGTLFYIACHLFVPLIEHLYPIQPIIGQKGSFLTYCAVHYLKRGQATLGICTGIDEVGIVQGKINATGNDVIDGLDTLHEASRKRC